MAASERLRPIVGDKQPFRAKAKGIVVFDFTEVPRRVTPNLSQANFQQTQRQLKLIREQHE